MSRKINYLIACRKSLLPKVVACRPNWQSGKVFNCWHPRTILIEDAPLFSDEWTDWAKEFLESVEEDAALYQQQVIENYRPVNHVFVDQKTGNTYLKIWEAKATPCYPMPIDPKAEYEKAKLIHQEKPNPSNFRTMKDWKRVMKVIEAEQNKTLPIIL